jgi:hypothetical protein
VENFRSRKKGDIPYLWLQNAFISSNKLFDNYTSIPSVLSITLIICTCVDASPYPDPPFTTALATLKSPPADVSSPLRLQFINSLSTFEMH